MSKKSILAVLAILLLVAASLLGLPRMVTCTPEPAWPEE